MLTLQAASKSEAAAIKPKNGSFDFIVSPVMNASVVALGRRV
jgi:hypothetical protein